MKDHLDLEQLSAYLDGEADEPARTERHLAQCPSCRERYEELAGLSSRLRAVPAPDVHPAFLTRVMAEVRELEPPRRRAWMPWLASLTALVAIAIGVSVLLPVLPRDASSGDSVSAGTGVSGELERRLAALHEQDMAALESEYDAPDDADTDVSADDLFAFLPEAHPAAATVEAVETEDWETTLGTLDAAETEALKKLLREYVEEVHNT